MVGAEREGYLPFRRYRVWYRMVGHDAAPGHRPLLALHGGPGGSHHSIEALSALAERGRRVILYDQLGGGNSDRPDDRALWTLDLFVDQLADVRRTLGLDRVHLWGLCWGGILALEHALTRPSGLESLILAGTYAATQQWLQGLEQLCAGESPQIRGAMSALMHANDAPGAEAIDVRTMLYRLQFQRRHLCRLNPWPDCLARAQVRREVFEVLNGPNDYRVTGRMRDWSVVDRLGSIRLPTLITSGRHDLVPPPVVERLHRGIAGSEWVIFEQSAHMAHLEETERYVQVLDDFLTRVEGGRASGPAGAGDGP
jgi:proline-specific peptidase